MKYKKNLIFIFLAIITTVQFIVFQKNNLLSTIEKENIEPIKIDVAIPFKDVYNNISVIDNLKIKNINHENNKWSITVYLFGNKDIIKNVLSKLKSYKIKNYKITGNRENLLLELELTT